MAENIQLSACKAIIKALLSSEEVASIFYKPVDLDMDLSTVRDRLNSGAYQTGDEFAKDVRLIFSKASTNPEHLCYEMGKKVEIIFEELYKKVKDDPNQLLTSMMSEDEEGEESSPEVTPLGQNRNVATAQVETMETGILADEPTMSTAEVEGLCPPEVDQFLFSTIRALGQTSGLLLGVIHLIHEQEGIEFNSENPDDDWLCFKIDKLKLYTKGLICMYLAQNGIKYN